MKNLLKAFLTIIVFSFYNCTSVSSEDLLEPIEEIEYTTYNDNVKAIIDSNCIACHHSGANPPGPFPLETYEQVKNTFMNGNGYNRINLPSGSPGAMPPSGALTSNQLIIMDKWETDGFLEE